ncbi:MAG: PQQ-binding-like beta-propeller repeat protein [Planctomycetota bacterium]
MTKTCLIATAVLMSLFADLGIAADGPWPQWRGPNRDDLSAESGLLQSWPSEGPTKLWSFENCGLGYSGPAVLGSRLYIMGARDGEEMLLCLDADTGEEIWAAPIGSQFENGWGNGPRGTPTVDGDFVYALCADGTLGCYRIDDGAIVWTQSMPDLGGKVPVWGYSESPVIHDDMVLVTPGGEQGAIVALDKATGTLLWQSKELTDDAHYSSIMIKEHAGKLMGVQLLVSQLVGFDVSTGEVLWSVQWPGRVAVIPTPVFWQDCVYVTSGYGTGCMLVRVAEDFTTEVVYDSRFMSNHHGGVILLDSHIFGHANKKGWACQDIATGKKVWLERKALEKGAIAYADGRFYCLGEDTGDVVLISASVEGWEEHGRFTLDPQSELRAPKGRIWTHPVIAGGRMYLRDQQLLYCFDISAK